MAQKLPPPPEVALALTESSSIINTTELERLELAATMLVVESQQDLAGANELLRPVVDRARQWADYWAPKKGAAHLVHKMLCDAEKVLADRLTRIRKMIEFKMSAFVMEERRKAEEEQAQLRRQAEAEAERLRLEAQKMMRQGFVAEAQQRATIAEQIVVPTVPVVPVQLEGTRARETWGCEVTDKMALVIAVADGLVPLDVFTVNESYITSKAREMGGLEWPGVKVKKNLGFAVGRGY